MNTRQSVFASVFARRSASAVCGIALDALVVMMVRGTACTCTSRVRCSFSVIAFTGTGAGAWAGDVVGQIGTLRYTIQGNVLTGQPALEDRNKQPAYWLVNGRLGVADVPVGGARLSLSVFGDNIFNKRYISFGAPVLLFTGSYERGRTYGVELGVNF